MSPSWLYAFLVHKKIEFEIFNYIFYNFIDNGIGYGYGLLQITKQSLKILQDTNGEVKDFIFEDIRLKDLKNPDIAIPMGIRWLARKQDTATKKLGRNATHDELAMEYKGLLKSKTTYQSQSFKNYKGHYERLKKK